MSFHHTTTPARLRKTAVIGALAALTATIAVAPAHADENCLYEVSTGDEYLEALECASDAETATTITLTDDIVIPAYTTPNYSGGQDLIIEGNDHAVTPHEDGENTFLDVWLGPGSANVTVQNITVQSFDSRSTLAFLYATQAESLTLENVHFLDNESGSTGLVYTNIPTTISESTFIGNNVVGGQAITAEQSLVIEDSTLSDNSSEDALLYARGSLNITGTTISNNEATGDMLIDHSGTEAGVVENSTFTNNQSLYGTLLFDSNAASVVRHSTFVDSTVLAENLDTGAHLSFYRDATLTGNIFIGATGAPSCVTWNSDVTLTSEANFDDDGSCTNNWADDSNIGDGLDAQLGALANNGGPTQTMLPAEDSPLIDAIPVQAGSPVTVDQRGIERPQGDGYDIGAVEVQVAVEDEDDDELGNAGGVGPGEDGTEAGQLTFQVKTDAGTIFGTASPAVTVSDINWTSTANLAGVPADTAVPYGASGFTIEVPNPGDSVTITLTAPTPFTSLYKVSGSDWSKIDGATFSNDGTTVTYTLTDGGDLDEDGEANGFIVDPVALAVEATFTG